MGQTESVLYDLFVAISSLLTSNHEGCAMGLMVDAPETNQAEQLCVTCTRN